MKYHWDGWKGPATTSFEDPLAQNFRSTYIWVCFKRPIRALQTSDSHFISELPPRLHQFWARERNTKRWCTLCTARNSLSSIKTISRTVGWNNNNDNKKARGILIKKKKKNNTFPFAINSSWVSNTHLLPWDKYCVLWLLKEIVWKSRSYSSAQKTVFFFNLCDL